MEGLTPVKITNRGQSLKDNNWEVTADLIAADGRREEETKARARAAEMGR